jgi:hypothetical protein
LSIRARGDYLDIAATGEEGATDENIVRFYRMYLFNIRRYFSDWGDAHLDSRILRTVVTNTITLPLDFPVHKDLGLDGLVVIGADLASADGGGHELAYTRVGEVLTLVEPLNNQDVFIGYNFESLVIPPRVTTSDASGIIQTTASLRINDWDVTLTGHISAAAFADYGEWGELFEWEGKKIGDVGYTTDAISYGRKTFRFPFMHNANEADLYLATKTHMGCNIHSLQWRGAYYKTGRRF